MSSLTSRGAARRHLLSGGLAAFSTAFLVPRALRAATDAAPLPLGIRALAFDAGAVLAAGSNGLSRLSPDRVDALPAPGAITCLATHPSRPGTILAGLETGGVQRSTDGGHSWRAAGAGLPDTPVLTVAAAAANPDMLYAALSGDGLYRSEDGGGSWSFVMDRPWLDGAEHDVTSLVSVGNPSGMGGIWLYGATAAGLSRVPDCFCRWQDIVPGNAMDALAAGTPLPAAAPLPKGDPVAVLALAPDAPDRIYAGTASGLWRSLDGGVNWTRAAKGAVTALAVDPADPLHLVAVLPSGLSVSRDGGTRWTLSSHSVSSHSKDN